MSDKTKMVIVVRKDLKMKPGKLAAQVGHAVSRCVGPLSEKKTLHEEAAVGRLSRPAALSVELFREWLYEGEPKVVLRVDTLDELMTILQKAFNSNIPHALIVDAARTYFKEATTTCLAIGPYDAKVIDEITGKLRLL